MKFRECVSSDSKQFRHNLEMFRKQVKRAKAKRKQERKNRKAGKK
jgi:hypothetical protein